MRPEVSLHILRKSYCLGGPRGVRVGLEPKIGPPGDFAEAERAAFCALVREGAQVAEAGLKERVNRARRLVFLHNGLTLAGIAAIKQPERNYRERVFERAGVPDRGCELELGYVVVADAYRGRKLSQELVRHAFAGFEQTALFATSRVDRVPMHRTLKRFGFAPLGHLYQSTEEGAEVQLFIRTAAQLPAAAAGGRQVRG